MKVLILGFGMQAKAALHDLVKSGVFEEIIAADQEFEAAKAYIAEKGYGQNVRCEPVDANSKQSMAALMAQVDIVIDLLPLQFIPSVVETALEQGCHVINTNFTTPKVQALATDAEQRGLTILPEFGMDPGIDLVMFGDALQAFDQIEEVRSYGAGVPELQAADNLIRYKISWWFEGVLYSYSRTGRMIVDGQVIEIPPKKMFAPETIHLVEVEGLGPMEAYPNGDVMEYVKLMGAEPGQLKQMGRYSMRWPGHSEFWHKMVNLHLLDDEPVILDGTVIDRRRFMAAAMEPHLQYAEDERDLAVILLEVVGLRAGRREKHTYTVIDRRDLETGLTGMNRTVGFTASIGAQMLASGQLTKRGLLSPVVDIPYEPFGEELRQRGIEVKLEKTVLEE